MSAEWLIYLAGVSIKVGNALPELIGICAAIGSLLVMINAMWPIAEIDTPAPPMLRKSLKYSGVILIICLTLSALMPTERTLYMIAGVSLSKEAMQSDVAVKVKNIVELKLNEEIDKLTKSRGE